MMYFCIFVFRWMCPGDVVVCKSVNILTVTAVVISFATTVISDKSVSDLSVMYVWHGV